MEMEMILLITENPDWFIKASIEEDEHRLPEPVKLAFDKSVNGLLLSLPPTGIKPNF